MIMMKDGRRTDRCAWWWWCVRRPLSAIVSYAMRQTFESTYMPVCNLQYIDVRVLHYRFTSPDEYCIPSSFFNLDCPLFVCPPLPELGSASTVLQRPRCQ